MEFAREAREPTLPEVVSTPSRLSYSALSTAASCAEAFRLERLYKIPKTYTWMNTIAGSAIHEVTEEIDRLEFNGVARELAIEMATSFEDRFLELLGQAYEVDGFEEVKISGSKLTNVSEQGGPNKKDKDWWLEFGPKFIQKWQDWKAETGYRIASLDGQPAIELPFDVDVTDGDSAVHVTGTIDRIFLDSYDLPKVVDIKTGSEPYSDQQLLTYAFGAYAQYDIAASDVLYWRPTGYMAGTRKPSPVGTTISTKESITVESMHHAAMQYTQVDKMIKAGVFLANPGDHCSRICPVIDYCRTKHGKNAWMVPLKTEVAPF